MTTQKLTDEQIANAVRNDYGDACFTLGDRVFPVKDLDYDSYVEMMRLAQPVIELVAGALDIKDGDGEADLALNPANIDYARIIELCGKDLPKMAWLCCKQSDYKITVDQVKQLARRPQVLIEVVLIQVQHNKLVEEFAGFFPRIGERLYALVPSMAEAMKPATVDTNDPTPLSS